MDINEGTTTDDLWTPYKELVAVVEGYLTHEGGGAPYAVHTFESVLRRHKQTFLSLLKNPAKNPASREEIKRGITEGVNLPSIGKTLLSKELVDEAIIISEMYNVNEYLALELLHTAQRQAPRNPGLPRGLVAVMLYYDGRRALVQALKELVMARDGVCWSISAREEIVSYVSRYVQQLVGDGLVEGVLDSLRQFTLEAELELLQRNRALPPPKHHARLVDSIEHTRKLLAGVIFAASAQRGLHRGLIRLINEQTTSPSLGPTGALDEVSLALQMALLYALDLSVLHRREDGEELAKMLPLIEDPELIPVLIDKLSPGAGGGDNSAPGTGVTGGVGAGAGARALCQLSLGLALAALKRGPQSLARHQLKLELLEHDELLVDAAIDGKVFEYLDEAILSTDYVWKEEYYQRRIHTLITDFIVLMHSKLMEMRVKADEAARTLQMYMAEGVAPPAGASASRTRLDALLRCVERLYRRDPHQLRHDYWLACHAPAAPHHSHSYRSGGRAATLYKFVRLSGELVCAALLPPYLRALGSLAVPRHTWALLARRDALSAHHLLTALQRYHTNLRADPQPFSDHQHSSMGASAIITPAARPGKLLVRQEEVEAMIAALKLIAAVAREDEAACVSICENLQWDAVNVMFGLVCCHVPLQLKAELLSTLGALGSRACTVGRVWAALEGAQLVGVADDKRALTADLHEVECRMEEYPLSRAFVSLLISLSGAGPLPRALGAGARAPGLEPYVHHVLHRLALPAPHRPHAQPHTRWQMLSLCFRLFALWLEQYEPSPSDFPPTGREPDMNPPPGFRLLLQLHSKSELLRLLLSSLDEAFELLDRQQVSQGKEFVEESLESVLQILERGLALERALVAAANEAGRGVLIVGLSKLLLAGDGPSGGDRLVTCCRVLQLGGGAAARATPVLARALQAPHAATHLVASLAHRHALAADVRYEAGDGPSGGDRLVTCCRVLQLGGGAAARATPVLARALQAPHAATHLVASLAHRHALAADVRYEAGDGPSGGDRLVTCCRVLQLGGGAAARATPVLARALQAPHAATHLVASLAHRHALAADVRYEAGDGPSGGDRLVTCCRVLQLGGGAAARATPVLARALQAPHAATHLVASLAHRHALAADVRYEAGDGPSGGDRLVTCCRVLQLGGGAAARATPVLARALQAPHAATHLVASLAHRHALAADVRYEAGDGPSGGDRLVTCCRVLQLGGGAAARATPVLARALQAPHAATHLVASLAHRHALAADVRYEAGDGPSGGDRLVTCCRVLQLGGGAAARATPVLARALQAPHAATHLVASLAHRHALAADVRYEAGDGPSGGDRLVTCCRVLQLGGGAAARATPVLARALQAPHAATHLVASLAHRHALAADVRHGFVECLEAEEWGPDASVVRQTKEGILLLLHQALPTAPPNLAHFLLGYQLDEDVSKSALNEAGAAGHPRTCLHAILDILDQFITSQPTADKEATNLIESCYRLVYWLCARPNTSAPALRYLRTRDYFLCRHIKATVNLETAGAVTISSRSWVLRACACEAGAAAAARHHAPLAALLAALTHNAQVHAQEWEWCLLRRTLEGLPVSVEAAAEPRWELFHAHQLRQALAACDLPTGLGGKRISVTRVHALLSRELAALHATAPQRNLVAQEIQKVLDYVTEVNRQRNLAATLTHYYDSWRQLTEIVFCVAPPDILSLESRKNLLLNILQDLLNKIPPAEVLPQLGNLASGTVLLLLVNLRHCYIMQKREAYLDASDFETSFFGPSSQIMQTKSLTLKFILHKILSWILVSGTSTQKMRVNLYGALLNYLNIVNLKSSPADPEEETNSTYVSRLDSSKAKPSKEESALKSMVIDVISGFGENLCSIVCSDCIGGGHDVCRMVALACLDTLLEIHPRTDWTHTLTNQGYLRSLIDSLLQDDEGLKEALEPNPKSLRVLYVYESKMALLVKLAGSRAGAETLLAQGALSCLANMSALSCHPDIHAATDASRDTQFLPPVTDRFRQILVPALSLCDALMTALGTGNHSCVLHVTHLLLSHADVLDMVLRAVHPNSPQELLIETEALTSVIGRASDPEVFGAVRNDTALQHSGAALQRLHSLMLALLLRFATPPQHKLAANNEHVDDDQTLYYKIVCNLLTFARNMIEHDGSRALFRPSLHGGGADAGPHLGALLQLLQNMLQRTQHLDKLLATQAHQLHGVPSMTLADIKKLIGDESEGVSPAEGRARAICLLRARARSRRREMERARAALDAALHLLWANLRVHLRLAAAPPPDNDSSLSISSAWRGAGGDDLPELRKGLISTFNDRFTDELLDTAKNQPPPHRGFLEVLLKDIKSMIQFSPL